jgi:methyltransferase (TIGR00027 family)
VATDPDDLDGLLVLARVLGALPDRLSEALSVLDRAELGSPGSPEPLTVRAQPLAGYSLRTVHRESRRSHTADGVAALRAAGARERDPGRRNPDHLAELLTSPGMRRQIRNPVLRRLALRLIDVRLPGIYLFVTARTRHLDAILAAELAGGAEQLVILGAGADSRAHRFAAELAGRPVFELDHPATSAWKRERVRALPGGADVRYVPIDFGTERLDDALDSAGAARDRRTLFLWEGVTPYLDPAAVDGTLATVGGYPAGSSVAFDYLYRSALDGTGYPDGARYLRYLRGHGEPLLFGIDPDDVPPFLTKRGLATVANARAEDLVRAHLTGPGGRPFGRSLTFSGIAHARVPA